MMVKNAVFHIFKKCLHSNPAVVCQHKTYQYVNNKKAVRLCHCVGQCPAKDFKR